MAEYVFSSLQPKLEILLFDASLERKAEIYAQWGIWHDLLDTLAQLQEEYPQDSRFQYAWDNLLQGHL